VLKPSKKIIALDEPAIHLIRGHRVVFDSDLAAIYQVSTKRLNEQLRRNRNRFPQDLAFQCRLDSHDESIANLFRAIRQLLTPPEKPKREIGFHVRENGARYRIRKTGRI
jgi:hypothetical protein